jgi:hypothetical protein
VANLPLSRDAKDSPVTADMTKPSVVQTQNPPVRVSAFARTPNRDLGSGGLAAKYAALAKKVKFVSLTHGDVGHQSQHVDGCRWTTGELDQVPKDPQRERSG